MSELSYAQLIEAKFRFFLKEKYPTTSSFPYPKQWLIDQFESILEEFPVLKAINYQELGISGLLSLIETIIADVNVFTNEDNTVLIIETGAIKPFITIKEFIVMFLLSALTDISLFHFIFSKKKMETINFNDVEAFPYIYENSVVLKNEDKQQYHFITSIVSIINHIYVLPDEFIKKITSRPKLLNKYGDSTLSEYIENNELRSIEDLALITYLKKTPKDIDMVKLSKSKNNNKL
jgi:hypothetical protein